MDSHREPADREIREDRPCPERRTLSLRNESFEEVHGKGLEPPRLAAAEPKSAASANFATRAQVLDRSLTRFRRFGSHGSVGHFGPLLPHTLEVPPPPHVVPAAHVPQLTEAPQPSAINPQLAPAVAHVFGTHALTHVPFEQL